SSPGRSIRAAIAADHGARSVGLIWLADGRERRGRPQDPAPAGRREADPGLHQRHRAGGGRRLLPPRARDRLLQASRQGAGEQRALAGDDARPVRQLRQERDSRRPLPSRRQGSGDLGRGDTERLMRVCLMIEGQESVSWEEWVALARTCEESPIEALFRSDHYASVMGKGDRGSLDAWATIAGLAAVTSGLRLGTLVSPVTFRHPSVLAKNVVTAGQIAGGDRIELGMGAGWLEAEHL